MTVIVGLLGALGAIVTGLTDWSDTYGAERRVGLNHALFNATATILYLVSFVLRLPAGPGDSIAAAIIGFVGLVSVTYAANLGGDMVLTKGTGVNHTAWEVGSEDYEAVMSLESVEENKLYRVMASGMPVILLRQGLQFHAISATCPHAGGPLDEGTLTGDVVECPWHGSRFCMRDGRVLTGPATVNAPRYDVQVRNGQDGFVSIEVSPYLAHDTEATLAEVRRFWHTIDRPNLMVKIPSTPEGVPAIRQALSEGININITLIFSIENYRQVGEAYLGALEERLARGERISHIASVASFFVSRVDVLVDQLLEDKSKAISESTERQQLKALQGRIAIANARLVYQEFKRLFDGPRFEPLQQRGARVQRPLWASTSTKNPAYRDVLYAEELIGPDTVDTMTLKTIESFRDHGRVRPSVEDNISQAQADLAALAAVGISYDHVTRQLQDEGVQKFADSFDKLFACIEDKRKAITGKNVSPA